MAEAKISIKVGHVEFSGEGDSKFLGDQLDKVLDKLPELTNAASNGAGDTGSETGAGAIGQGTAAKGTTLASFLKAKAATTNQTRKFLATAVWLHDTKGKDRLTTSEVSQALVDAKQLGLSNASQSLNNNIKQGFCHKDGKKQFFVTDEGREELS
jgi:hypothetical protein